MSKKTRTEIPRDVAAAVLFESNRTCCVCRIRGKPVQVHHLDENPDNHIVANLAVLCFDCHRDTQIRGGFDRKLDAAQVVLYRDDWTRRIANQRTVDHGPADVQQVIVPPAIHICQGLTPAQPSEVDISVINNFPLRRLKAYREAQPKWDIGVTADMVEANNQVVETLLQILVDLARFYPAGHFDGRRADDYFRDRIQKVAEWHRQCLEPHGPGTGGTIVSVMTGGETISSVERMVEDMVNALTSFRDDFNYHGWRTAWRGSA